MNMIRRLLMAGVWALCLINLVRPLEAPLENLFYIVLGVLVVLHGLQVVLFSKVLQLDLAGKVDVFIFGGIAANERRKALLAKMEKESR
ncbi:hypothetical protein B3C1_10457 [Gallaecimonas xiamenensis 3-C-1]|uniref:DUF1145 domain-containing protein n=2 Tax=Gallaecimonas TaxID=745410 RepID=K2IRZ4_9GAMM|nr:hypothetical protein B3C1_10457 [Gallaecimonas xiamenensis 3-C-1]